MISPASADITRITTIPRIVGTSVFSARARSISCTVLIGSLMLAGVVGAGFMWRQVARELVAFLPLGVVLKVAIAYAGTYATGQAIYHWYATGEKLDRQQLRQIFNEALVRGKEEAVALVERMRRHDEAALDEPAKASRRRIALPRRRARAV